MEIQISNVTLVGKTFFFDEIVDKAYVVGFCLIDGTLFVLLISFPI